MTANGQHPLTTENPRLTTPTTLARKLTLADAVFIGLGAMIGAGHFRRHRTGRRHRRVVAPGFARSSPPRRAAAMRSRPRSSPRLYPAAGGTYVYGRERLGHVWGYLAGWGFVIGKVASCAAMALTFGFYVNDELRASARRRRRR